MHAERLAMAELTASPDNVHYPALFEWAASGMAVTSLKGRFLVANPALCRMLGRTEEELRRVDFLSVTHPDDRALNQQHHHRLLKGEIPSFAIEKRYLRKDATSVWVRMTAALIRDPDDTPLYVAATVEDISSHKIAAEQLGLSQSLLRVGGRTAKVGGWAVDLPGEEVFWSDEIFEMLDAPADTELTLPRIYALYPPEARQRVHDAFDACARHGTPFDLEVEGSTFSGRTRWIRVVGEPERATDGTITRVAGALQDISELKAARDEVAEVADRLTSSLESTTDAVYLLDRDWRFTYLNPRAEELLRHDRDELRGQSIWEVFPEAVHHPVHDAFHSAVRDATAVTLEAMCFPPLDRWFSQHVHPSSRGLAVSFRDVTEQHEIRVALEQREAELAEQAALLDETREAILVQDPAGVVTYWNRGAERLYGWTSAEALGRPATELVAGTAAEHAAAARAVETEGVWRGALTHATRDGRDLRIEARWTLLGPVAGSRQSILVTHTDVTTPRRLERALIRSQRIESLATLAGGMAHDLNNALAPIFLAIELLSTEETDPRKRAMLGMIEGSAHHGAAMVRQILSFARGVEAEPVDLDVTRVFDDVVRIAAETFPRDIRLSIEFSPSAGCVRGDETQLRQVLMNLLLNARQAMPEGGRIRCSAYDLDVDDPEPTTAGTIRPAHYLVLQVEDEGQGMSPEVAERVFEPFFTTKRHGEGAGLGLSTALAIVEGHGGHMDLDSVPGRGTNVRVLLPTLATHPEAEVSGPPGRADAATGATVLVVDAEPRVRALMQQTLEVAGYRVISACDGAEAVALYRLRHDEIAVVITDLVMPGMSVAAAIDTLQRIDPEVRIVAASGLADHPGGEAVPPEVEHVLAKPFTATELLRVTASVLAGES